MFTHLFLFIAFLSRPTNISNQIIEKVKFIMKYVERFRLTDFDDQISNFYVLVLI